MPDLRTSRLLRLLQEQARQPPRHPNQESGRRVARAGRAVAVVPHRPGHRLMPDEPVVVTGATGLHGGAVCRGLLAAGRPVRALTRDPHGVRGRPLSQLGAELVVGDLMVTESLVAAIRGACAVYAV